MTYAFTMSTVKLESIHPRLNIVKVTAGLQPSAEQRQGAIQTDIHSHPWPNGIWIMDLTFRCCLPNKLKNSLARVFKQKMSVKHTNILYDE